MTVPCCLPTVQGDPRRFECIDVADADGCRNHISGRAGIPGPEGTRCFDPTEGQDGCFSCNKRDLFEVEIGCCYGGTQFFFESGISWASNCFECGGEPAQEPGDCFPTFPDPTCRHPAPDRPNPLGTKWTIDLLGTVAMALSPANADRGINHPLSANRTRPEPPENRFADPCVHLEGRDVMLDDGEVYVEMCSQPDGNNQSARYSYATLRNAEGTDRLEDGCQYDIGSIHLPYWTEAIVRSHQNLCGGRAR